MGLIRILLALFVVFYHCGGFFGVETMPGNIAVELFFIVSGFYMTLILNEKYVGAKGTYSLFITNRFFRLYPIYLVILFLGLFTALIYAFATSFTNFGQLNFFISNWNKLDFFGKLYLLLVNLSIIGQDIVMFLGLDNTTGSLVFTKNYALSEVQLHQFLLIPQAWSISIEIIFYLIAPFILRKSAFFLVGIALISLLIKIYLHNIGLTNDPWTYRFFPAEFLFFCLGALSYKGYTKIKAIKSSRYINIAIFITTIIVLLTYSHLHYYIRQYFIFIGFAFALPFIFLLTKYSKIDREIGELSYPIYISHVFFKSVLSQLFNSTFIGACCATVSIIFSFFLNNIVSKRVEVFRQKRFEKSALIRNRV